ncbi:predicted protein [Verticillium alfalfae VaMs.102]|uniref:Predicted protein n=1 Tax=Verticillium alfalfae (strain VaMs.102 / ATCC MYA-4576 / FGSC 10136) TaxID=526221 RepID=C9SE74_VERA1|nr:predicted protein [Verticillium alfalfae VaMs.102]EEY16483.1 predicted protein [Verticillium alfalfae VaMs.102]
MCQTVYYSYSCGHLECVVYRCRRIPAHPSRWELYDCVTRAAVDGSWRTSLREPCHDCVEAERPASRQQQQQQQQQHQVASQQRLLRHVQGSRDGSASSSSSMGWDGRVIRPLDSNYLGNIGRITLDGVHWEDVTPAEIFEARF